jgi:hypothetical protein
MIKVRGSGRIETPEKKLLRSATTALRPKTKVVLPEKHLDVGAIPKREAAAMRAAFSASESRAELRHVIDRETALREAPATNSPLENYGETSHKKLMLNRPDSGGAALEQSQFVQLARKIGFATAGRLLVGAASPDEQRALKTGMAECVREVTSPEPPAAAPFREALEAMTLKDRRAALIQHYGLLPDKDGKYRLPEKSQWRNAKEGEPTPEKFRAWLDVVFPDRREIGMVLSDLKHLDKDGYEKVVMWLRKNTKVTKAEVAALDLPSRITKYDPVRDANAPKSWPEVYERAARGQDGLKNLKRTFQRVQPHL